MTEDNPALICRHHIKNGITEAIAWTQHYRDDHAQHPTIQSRCDSLLHYLQEARSRAESFAETDREPFVWEPGVPERGE